MQYFDREMAERVWKRVQGEKKLPPPQQPPTPLKALIYTAAENSAVYQALSRQLRGRDAATLRRFHQETEKAIACMAGISRVLGQQVKLPRIPVPKEHHRRALEKAYLREKQLLDGFNARASDPEHGMVFSRLAVQANNRCVSLAERLGREDRD